MQRPVRGRGVRRRAAERWLSEGEAADELRVTRADLLGFSIGSFVAQEIALVRPDRRRARLLLFEHHAEFAGDVEAFLTEPPPSS